MRCSPPILFATAALTTLAVAQALAPTARAQPVAAPPLYHVRLDWQKAEPVPGGLVIRGRITNTGATPLTYTQVTPTLLDGAGREVFRGSGYLTASPLLPGRSAEFRAFGANTPRFAGLRILFREAGHPVLVDHQPITTVVRLSAPPVKTAKALEEGRAQVRRANTQVRPHGNGCPPFRL